MIKLLVSRCDRLGDLVLSLPTLGYLRDSGHFQLYLHHSDYAKDVARWALHNGLIDGHWPDSSPAPKELGENPLALSLFHCRQSVEAFKRLKVESSLGPRSKLSALWGYRWSIRQSRSKVEKSEMHYNLDLAGSLLEKVGLDAPKHFKGLAALKVPTDWSSPRESPHSIIVVSNRGSAANWPIEKYIDLAANLNKQGLSVDFLVSGLDAPRRRQAIEASGLLQKGVGMVGDFESISQLIVYLSQAQKVYSSSTGPLHLAHAAGVRVYGIYPSRRVESFDRWRPDGFWHRASVEYEVISGA